MNMATKQYLLAWCLAGLASSSAITSIAETLRDPTMPPAQLLQKTGTSAEILSEPVLQSTKLGEPSNAVMISGEMVSLGQQYHGAKLVKVTENTAVLKGSDGKQQVLRMDYPIERKWLLAEASQKSIGDQKAKKEKSSKQIYQQGQ